MLESAKCCAMCNFIVAHCEELSRKPSDVEYLRGQVEYFTHWETEVFLWLMYYVIICQASDIFGWLYMFELTFNILKNDEKILWI
jgi:hypothetical protein